MLWSQVYRWVCLFMSFHGLLILSANLYEMADLQTIKVQNIHHISNKFLELRDESWIIKYYQSETELIRRTSLVVVSTLASQRLKDTNTFMSLQLDGRMFLRKLQESWIFETHLCPRHKFNSICSKQVSYERTTGCCNKHCIELRN